MSKKTKHGRTRHSSSATTNGSPSTRHPKTQQLSADQQRAITGELMGALLGAITFGALQEQ